MIIFPKVGLIFLSFPTPEWQRDIQRAFVSLQSMRYPFEQIEIICVESKSPSEKVVKPWFEQTWMPKSGKELPRITYLFKEEVIGFSGNNNLGFEKAKEFGCEYVYLLNEDAEVHPDFLRTAVERATQDPNIAYVQSLILLGQDKNLVNTVGNAYHFLGFGYSHGYLWTRAEAEDFFVEEQKRNPKLEIGYVSGAGVLGRVQAIEACGGLFDTKFFSYHEDTDATLRAKTLGYLSVVEPTSIIYHYYEFDKTQLKKNYWSERNRFVLVFSYYRLWTLFLLAPMFLVMELALIFFSLKTGWWREKWKVYKDLCTLSFWSWVWKRRREIQRMRRVGDRELLKRAVGEIAFQGEGVKNPVLTYIGNPVMKLYWGVVRKLIL